MGSRAQAGLVGGGEGLRERCRAQSQQRDLGFGVGCGHQAWVSYTTGWDRGHRDQSSGVGGSGLGLVKGVLGARLGIMEQSQWVSVSEPRLMGGIRVGSCVSGVATRMGQEWQRSA